jgi:hypothetical protein
MKTILITLSLLLLSINSVFSQNFEGGILCGLNSSQVDGDYYSGYNKFGVSLGFYTYTPLSDLFDFQLEIKYMGKGAKSTKSTDYTCQLNYIEIPLLLRLNSNSKAKVEFGTGLGYLFSNTFINSYGEEMTSSKFHKVDWSGVAGLNYPLTDQLFVNMRLSYSLISIRNRIYHYDDFKYTGVYNNVLTVSLYYKFSSGR